MENQQIICWQKQENSLNTILLPSTYQGNQEVHISISSPACWSRHINKFFSDQSHGIQESDPSSKQTLKTNFVANCCMQLSRKTMKKMLGKLNIGHVNNVIKLYYYTKMWLCVNDILSFCVTLYNWLVFNKCTMRFIMSLRGKKSILWNEWGIPAHDMKNWQRNQTTTRHRFGEYNFVSKLKIWDRRTDTSTSWVAPQLKMICTHTNKTRKDLDYHKNQERW